MSERIGAPRISRIHGEVLRGNGMRVLGNGNGKKEMRFLGRRSEIDVSGKNGEATREVIEFLQQEFGINGELAGEFAREMCEGEK